MTYRATKDVLQRVMPLIEQFATRSIEKARLLQYLSARSGIDWGVHELVRDELITDPDAAPEVSAFRQLTVRDRQTGEDAVLRYPDCLGSLPEGIEALLIREYQRLATNRPLTVMAQPLFTYLYSASHCERCRWHGEGHAQIQRECHFAGHPINFEPMTTLG